jgi:hypothetical protein
MTWKENLGLVAAVLLSGVVLLGIFIAFMAAIPVAFLAVGVPFVLTFNAVVAYATIITYPGLLVTCLAAARFFAWARGHMPRKFFDWLASGAFWYFFAIAASLCLVCFSWIFDNHGWPMAIAAVAAVILFLKAWDWWETWPQVTFSLHPNDMG